MTKNVDAALELVEALSRCRCCLQRAPDRVLDRPYARHGRTEIYLDMLKECFDIHLTSSSDECGICEECVGRLRDASDFKLQVQRSQAELRERLERALKLYGDGAKSQREEGPYEISSDGESSEPQRDSAAAHQESTLTTHMEEMHTDSAAVRAEEEACTCDTCGERFTDKMDLVDHVQTHTQTAEAYNNAYTCKFCNRKCKNRTLLINHVRTHTGERPYACKKCHRRFTQRQNRERHVKNGSCRYYLKKSKNFGSKLNTLSSPRSSKDSEIFTNVRTDTPNNIPYEYSCEICGKGFVSKGNLNRHVTIHSEKPFQCKICHKLYSQQRSLSVHFKRHTGEKRFSCPTCTKNFSHRSNMYRHMKTHTGEKPYCCEICKRRFTMKNNMLRHVKTHATRKPYSCIKCNKSFKIKSIFVTHVKSCTSKLNLDNHTGEKKFECDVCSKQFNHRLNLISHIRIHTGSKPYGCSVCKKLFSARSNMYRHMKTHALEKPYPCGICYKAFTRKYYLNEHMKTHQKIHRCDLCNRRFTQKSKFVVHVQKCISKLDLDLHT